MWQGLTIFCKVCKRIRKEYASEIFVKCVITTLGLHGSAAVVIAFTGCLGQVILASTYKMRKVWLKRTRLNRYSKLSRGCNMKTQPKIDRYTYRVIWSEEDAQCVGLCAEFPSLSHLASTAEKAIRGIRRVVADVIEDMQANGESIPEPLSS